LAQLRERLGSIAEPFAGDSKGVNPLDLRIFFGQNESISPFGERVLRALPQMADAVGRLIDIFNTRLDASDKIDDVIPS